jgi:hypothetical protein
MEPEEFVYWNLYRMAYGLAADRVERSRFSADRIPLVRHGM